MVVLVTFGLRLVEVYTKSRGFVFVYFRFFCFETLCSRDFLLPVFVCRCVGL